MDKDRRQIWVRYVITLVLGVALLGGGVRLLDLIGFQIDRYPLGLVVFGLLLAIWTITLYCIWLPFELGYKTGRIRTSFMWLFDGDVGELSVLQQVEDEAVGVREAPDESDGRVDAGCMVFWLAAMGAVAGIAYLGERSLPEWQGTFGYLKFLAIFCVLAPLVSVPYLLIIGVFQRGHRAATRSSKARLAAAEQSLVEMTAGDPMECGGTLVTMFARRIPLSPESTRTPTSELSHKGRIGDQVQVLRHDREGFDKTYLVRLSDGYVAWVACDYIEIDADSLSS